MAKLFPTTTTTTTMLAIVLASIISMLAAAHDVSDPSISAPTLSLGLEECHKKASDGKCKDEFVLGTLKKGYVIQRCCDVLGDVGKDCFIGILKTCDYSANEKIDWNGFWNNSTKILKQCNVSS